LISNTLILVDGNKEFAVKILSAFVKDLPQNIKQLNESLKAEDEKMINSMGHKIKSSFRMLKLNELADISFWIEQFDIKNNDWNILEEKIKILESKSQQYLLVAKEHIENSKL
jgi:HPt (histidine-containing phosphotransfer) domain-containing protein